MVDFAHVPVIKRMTRMPVCIDPSHSVGTRRFLPTGSRYIPCHRTGFGRRGHMSCRFSSEPAEALVDGPQALTLDELPLFLEDVN